jgi:hypothetical protein
MVGGKEKAGNAREQILAQEYIREEIARKIGLDPEKFTETKIPVGESYLIVNGFSRNPHVICEASARIGPTKSAQTHKIMNDALKMLFIEQHLGHKFRKVMAFIDEKAASKFTDGGWHGECLRKFDIEVMVVDVPEEIKQAVLRAQKRQIR